MRHRRRIALQTETGRDILLDLPRAARLREGDGLLTETGEIVRVLARPEPLMEINAPAPDTMVRIAWHLGNRHLPVQVIDTLLRIRADHVIADMVTRLGGTWRTVTAPFDPEAGAYAGGHHHHDHNH
ncbi:MAG: urease accessory protein UreE [Acetobacteraceae bacterium]|nr:urease accessory protein UreE [Acetobacteraceae bacterium]